MTCGIYCIENILDSKRYVGQSKYIEHRYNEHMYKIRNSKDSLYLQRAVNLYGIESFIFYILEICNINELDLWESFWVSSLNTHDKEYGYNLTSGGKGIPGYKHITYINSPFKSRVGSNNSFFGKHHTEETKNKLSIMHLGLGHPHSKESKEKISIGNKGKNLGKHPTPEQIRLLSEIKLGSKNPFFGKHHSDESKRKISETKLKNKLVKLQKVGKVEL